VALPAGLRHVPRAAGALLPDTRGAAGTVILAASNPDELVLDPFAGTGTALAVARRLGRRYLGIELCEETAALARGRLAEMPPAASA
jgi:DNA modification methylase